MKNYLVKCYNSKTKNEEVLPVRARNKSIAIKIIRSKIFRKSGAAGFKNLTIKAELKPKRKLDVQLNLFEI